MLLGRDGECARIDRLLDEAMQGRGGALVLVGEAGVGKSRLLSYAVERAPSFRVLRCSGIEGETHLAFSGLSDLLRPILDELAMLPEPQAKAVASALALDPRPGRHLHRFAAYAGVLSLLAHVAESRPTLLAIDDVQHLDAPTQEALGFLARRLAAEAVAVLMATRPGWAHTSRAEYPVLAVEGLSDAAGRALLRSLSPWPIAPRVEDQLVTETDGNPLALTEIIGGLRPAQLAGLEPIGDPLPVGPRIANAFRSRVSGLRASSRRALLLLSAASTTDPWLIDLVLARAGLSRSDLGPAERVDLIRLGDEEIRFLHPLVRGVVSQDATSQERREAHVISAEAFEAAGLGDRAVWHRAASVEAPDEGVAAALEASALEARARGGHAAAAITFERSSQLSATATGRVRRLVRAAEEQETIGHHARAIQLLARASDEAADEDALALIELRQGRLRVFEGAVNGASDGLIAGANRIERKDRSLAAEMLTDASLALLLSRGTDAARETAGRALELAHGTPGNVQIAAQILVARLLASAGHPVGELPIPPQWLRWLQQDDPLLSVRRLGYFGAWFLWYLDPTRSAAILDRAIAGARSTTALGALPFLLAARGDTRLRLGRWLEAGADLTEGVHLAEETSQPGMTAWSKAMLARLEAARGREGVATEMAAQAMVHADSLGLPSVRTYALSALGLLELGLRRFASATDRLEEAERWAIDAGWTEPSAFGGPPDLAEAYVRLGRRHDARRLIDRLRDAAASGHPWTRGALARCRGLLEPTPRFETLLREAIDLHERTLAPFEIGRDRLILGERLRRVGRRARAREELEQAREIFDRLGAAPWSEVARSELTAAGASASPPRPTGIDGLTPREVQVALLIAQGTTNLEAAAAFFVTPKTIEYHLGNIYGKLAVRSRTELARLVASEGLSDQSTDGASSGDKQADQPVVTFEPVADYAAKAAGGVVVPGGRKSS